ncbi:retrovirus-related pol polyprotein from transposon TNT 1-94 [Tanacetum coccineum]|uniref:Retrovirus-related pol polyprotein from transposon TNT 1-94 n=1 Tax=Tanacetum coccineum TaxID=301880 RepID=A0ABQ4YEQ5_9ASTR
MEWKQTFGKSPTTHRLYDPTSKKIIISRDVVYDEFSCWNWEDTSNNQKSQIENEEEQNSSKDLSPTQLTQPRRSEHNLIPRCRFLIEGEDTPSLDLFVGDQVNVEEAIKMEEWRLNTIFSGIESTQVPEGIFMSQRKYVEDTLKKFNMQGCKIVATPMDINKKLHLEDGTGLTDATMYRSLQKESYVTLKELKVMGFYKTKDFRLQGYTNSDWAGCVEDKRSTSGNCFILGIAAIC